MIHRPMLLLASLLALFTGTAQAASTTVPSWVSEVRAGVLKHDIKLDELPNPFTSRYQTGFDLNGEVFFTAPELFKYILRPRPSVGTSVNLSGGTSHAYTNLNWGGELENGLIGDFFIGFAAHTGVLDKSKADPTYNNSQLLGSRVLFHVGLEGGYRFDNGYGVTMFYEHLSNGSVLTDGPNRGMDNIGLRVGYRFN